MHTQVVLLVGHPQADGHAVGDWAHPFQRFSWHVERVNDLAAATARLSRPDLPAPQLVVLDESRPGCWTTAQVEGLRRLAPLARLVRYSGSWCEGHGRSGRPPLGTAGLYWHRWAPQIARQLEAIAAGENPPWAQPLTFTPDERSKSERHPAASKSNRGTILIRAASASTVDAVRAVCVQAGYVVSTSGEVDAVNPPPRAALWDTYPEALHDAATIAGFRQSAGGAAVLALVGFPRPLDVQAALAAGVRAVISKPWDRADLLWHLEQLPSTMPSNDASGLRRR